MNSESPAQPWVTIAPIRQLNRVPSGLAMPFNFSNDTSIQQLPDWLTSESEDEFDLLKPRLSQIIADRKLSHCIAVEYEANALGSPDPEWPGPGQRAIQESAVVKIHTVFLALWLARPTAIYYKEMASCAQHDSDWIVRQFGDYYGPHPLNEYENDQFRLVDFDNARQLFEKLRGLAPNSTVYSAISSLGLALTQTNWPLRYLVHWLVLESLFGPSDARETTFRISQRISFFLADNRENRRDIFSKIKDSYGWRSRVVHGLRLNKLKKEKSGDLMSYLERTVRKSLVRILEDDELVSIFSEKRRESYLEDIVFNWHA